MSSLWSLIEPGAKEWSDDVHAINLAYAKEHGYPAPPAPSIGSVASCSQAISLKRIADALDRMVQPVNYAGLFKPDGTPNSILDIAGEHTGDTRRPKESP